MSLKKRRDTSLTARPGMVRPARPARCLHDDCEHQVVTRQDISLLASYWIDRRMAKSMIPQTDGNVKELSAMFEARTTLQMPGPGARKTSSCSSRGIKECIGKIRKDTPAAFFGVATAAASSRHSARRSALAQSKGAKVSKKEVMSAMPGRKMINVQRSRAIC
mmetsp:Transcript_15214/g.33430  ORF Transcript_15214/g.33430 Transcript_15214/m.33430 type:complete len:163 (-) Transcript_15214:1006-1494(-)